MLKNLMRALRVFTLRNTNHPLGLLGLAVMYLSGLLLLVLLTLNLLSFHSSPYLGILTFLVLPVLFAGGAALVFLGRYRASRKRGDGEVHLYPFPNWDLNDPAHRSRFVVLLLGATLLLTISATLSYRGVEFMESETFCGQTCHTVMQPEYTAFQRSPHARVSCVECHIGPGADWFVRSKLSGLRQVWAVLTDSYAKPVPTPIHNLRPSRDTCEQCHWPEKFYGDKVVVHHRFEEDEANTPLVDALVLKVGGGGLASGFTTGIHWHMSVDIEYISDEKREEIQWVRYEDPSGEVHEYFLDGFEPGPGFFEENEPRRMDCLDCHNRPTHTFQMPDYALDDALQAGSIDPALPYVKREAMAALQAEYPDRETAAREIPARLAAHYADGEWAGSPELERAGAVVADIWAANIFPAMDVTWGSYPNHIGHEKSPGCFRCHDEEHSTAEGRTITQDCDTCHTLLAWEERDPEILETLYP